MSGELGECGEDVVSVGRGKGEKEVRYIEQLVLWLTALSYMFVHVLFALSVLYDISF